MPFLRLVSKRFIPWVLSRKKRILLSVLFLGWCVSISGVFGNNGLIQAYELSQARRDLRLRVTALEKEKKRLEESLRLIQSDSVFQEKAIRETLGFVRDQELVFEFK